MKERPILFTSANAQKVHVGTKTQTRRIVKGDGSAWENSLLESGRWPEAIKCPYGQPGDRLWVREMWGFTASWPIGFQRSHIKHGGPWLSGTMAYRADNPKGNWCWRPSIHMPRWACRTVLELTAVRVERLQEISEEDAEAEGVHFTDGAIFEQETGLSRFPCLPHRKGYERLWESINGHGSWTLNPWVWVLEFRKVQ